MPNMTNEQQDEEFKRKFGDNPTFNEETCIELLKFCSYVEDTTRWNKWRNENPKTEILLDEADLKGATLTEANLDNAMMIKAHLEGAFMPYAHLNNADLTGAFLQGVDLGHAILEGADLNGAHLEKASIDMQTNPHNSSRVFDDDVEKEKEACLNNANLKGAVLAYANLEGADLSGAILENADLNEANLKDTTLDYTNFKNANLGYTILKGAVLLQTDLQNANLEFTDLTDATLWMVNFENANLMDAIFNSTFICGKVLPGDEKTNLKGTDFTGITVNGETIIRYCTIDEKTNFSMVALDSARVDPSLLAALKTNIRRITWNKYYDEQKKLRWGKIKIVPIRIFWWLSDYGSSSERIFLSILISILLFTDVYLIIGSYAPNVISLPEQGAIATPDIVPISDSYIRVICFAISTMVTLGFGGINVTIDKAFPKLSNVAFLVVTLNLVLGYLFLSVLVTRFGILFQSQAPEQKAKKTNNAIPYSVALILLASSSYMLFCWENIIGFINYAALITVLFGMGYFHFK